MDLPYLCKTQGFLIAGVNRGAGIEYASQYDPQGWLQCRRMNERRERLRIGNIELENRLILAPMAGMARLPLRLAYRQLGAAMTCVGVIDAAAVAQASTDELINFLGKREVTSEQERPVCVQLLGGEVRTMAAAARRIQRFASIIDLNFSGPLQKVLARAYGAALLKNVDLIREIVGAVVEGVDIPVTAKVRIGFHGPDVDVIRIAQCCQKAGAAALVVHARFVDQMYRGPAHWEWIQRIKENVDIPVIGNGAVHDPHDARAMLEQTGCDFVMIGTAAYVNPLIFFQTNRLLETGHCPRFGTARTLFRFLNVYRGFVGQIEGKGPWRFLRSSCKNFLRVRAFMQAIQSGRAALE